MEPHLGEDLNKTEAKRYRRNRHFVHKFHIKETKIQLSL